MDMAEISISHEALQHFSPEKLSSLEIQLVIARQEGNQNALRSAGAALLQEQFGLSPQTARKADTLYELAVYKKNLSSEDTQTLFYWFHELVSQGSGLHYDAQLAADAELAGHQFPFNDAKRYIDTFALKFGTMYKISPDALKSAAMLRYLAWKDFYLKQLQLDMLQEGLVHYYFSLQRTLKTY